MSNASIEKDLSVSAAYDGMRLDRFLTEHLHPISRSEIQRWIKHGEIRVNDKNAISHQALKAGDHIHITHQETSMATPAQWESIEALDEHSDFVIVNKPAGILVHPTPSSHERTLIHWLIERYPEVQKVGEDPQRPGIVHRLDRSVSGLMLIPRTQEAFAYYKKLFHDRQMSKTYTALVHGVVEADGRVEMPITRSQSNRKRMAARADGIGRPAVTDYVIKKRYPHLTLLEVKPKTGRMHQIRVHLNAIGHPIIGDRLYAKKTSRATDLERPFLHASQLAFTDQQGQTRAYTCLIPLDLQQYIDTLDEKHENS